MAFSNKYALAFINMLYCLYDQILFLPLKTIKENIF